MSNHTKPFACGRCDLCEQTNYRQCEAPRGGCRCAECVPPRYDAVFAEGTAMLDADGAGPLPEPERTYTRAEVEALLKKQREACADLVYEGPEDRYLMAKFIRATPLVEVKP